MNYMRYCIIGNGTAGIDAALSIRQKDVESEIIVISASKYTHYFRPKLIDYIKEDLPAEKLFIYKDDFYVSRNINTINETRIDKIDPAKSVIVSNSGKEYGYDKLLLALGAAPFIPPVVDCGLKGVFSLRGIADADRIRTYCRGKKHIVMSGGGLLGLETAYALKGYCEMIIVVDMNSCLLNRQLDRGGAALLKQSLEARGLSFALDDCIDRVNGSSQIESITLKSGKEVKADALIISAGVRPNITLPSESGITVKRGIVVNDNMETSIPGIYAAGDCAEHRDVLYGLWTVAKEQGKIAGLNMAGESTSYAGSVPSTMLKVSGIDLYSAGTYDETAGESLVSSSSDKYLKIVYSGDTPLGIIVIGDPDAVRMAQKVMAKRAPMEEFIKLIPR